MTRRHAIAVLCACLFATASAFAVQAPPAPITGTWTGFLTNGADPNDRNAALMVLKQAGTELTGTGGPNENEQWTIQKGKVTTNKEGTTVTFALETDNLSMQFEMKLVDGKLKGTVSAQRGTEKRAGTVEMERAKSDRQ